MATANMNAQQYHDILLTLRRPTIIERLKENLPFPDGAVPKNGLPFWERIPLSKKLPIIDHPEDAFVLYRDKLGRKLWRPSPAGAFRLDDPYCLDVSYDYDPLHDGNLATYFKSQQNRKVLRKQGLLSKNDEAVCSLSQFNNYRRYLLCIYRECLKLEYNRLFEDQIDQINLKKAQMCMEREMKKVQQKEERLMLTADTRKQREEEALQKIKMRELQRINYDERIERILCAREEDRKRRLAASKEMDAKVKYRNAVAAEIRGAKVIATMQAWRINEMERCKRVQEQQRQLQALKEKEVADRWNEKIDTQLDRIEREQQILQEHEEQFSLAVQLRAMKMENQHLRMLMSFKKMRKAQCKEKQRKEERLRSTARHKASGDGQDRGDETSSRRRGIASRRTRDRFYGKGASGRRRQTPQNGNVQSDTTCDPNIHYRRKIARLIKALNNVESDKQTLELWKSLQKDECVDDEEEDEENIRAPEVEWEDLADQKRRNRRGTEQDNKNARIQVDATIDVMLTNVIQEVVHRRVMYTLRYVYHEALSKCRYLVEREEKRQALKDGWACNHSRPIEDIPDINETISKMCQHSKGICYNTTTGGCCQPGPSAHARASKRPTFNPQKMLRKLKAMERRNERLKATLERGPCYDDESLNGEDNNGTRESRGEDDTESDSDTDGGRLDKNFEAFADNLRRRIIILASQSIDERFKKFTVHRWKIMKEVELVELMERLCNMMLMYDAKEFLPSGEFQWAADILARDIMKEVRAQIRSEKRDRLLMHRAEVERHRARKQRRQRERDGPPKFIAGPCKELTPTKPEEPKALSPEDVPVLSLHNRSPHQPSLPSIASDE